MRDEGAAEGAGRVCRSVFGDCAKTRLAEDVTAGLTAVRAEVDVETHGAGEALPVLPLAVQQGTAHTLSLDAHGHTRTYLYSGYFSIVKAVQILL